MASRQHFNARARRRGRQIKPLVVVIAVLVVGVVVVEARRAGHSSPRTDTRPSAAAPAPGTTPRSGAAAGKGPETSSTTTAATSAQATGVLASSAVGRYLAGRTGDTTAAVYNVANGTTSLWRPGVSEYTASIVKVDILATLLDQAQNAGTTLSAGDQAEATPMIEQSDDDAATDLWDAAGQQTGVGAFNHLLGLSATTPGTDGYWGDTQTTAADQVKLLKAVVQPGTILDSASRRYELGLMENIESDQAWGISAGVPAGVTLALKNGWLPLLGDGDWQVNSIGWVDGQGRDYIVAVMTKNNDTEGYGIDTIQGLSSLIWSGLAPGA